MIPSGSKAFSSCGEAMPDEEDSNAVTVCAKDTFAEYDSKGFSICRRATSSEECVEDSEWTVNTTAVSKRTKEDVNAWIFRGTKMDADIWSALDEYLLEKIIARLPFRSLFRAMSLSKAWRDKFRSQAFFREVNSSAAASWKCYTPLLVNRRKDMVGYDRRSKLWHRLPTHSYLPQDVAQDVWSLRAGHGSLLCWTCTAIQFTQALAHAADFKILNHVHVTNPLTKSWKQLPLRPDMNNPQFVHVIGEGREAYKVVLCSLRQDCKVGPMVQISVQVFDSTLDSWTENCYSTQWKQATCIGSAVLNGVLHMNISVASGLFRVRQNPGAFTSTRPRSTALGAYKWKLISLALKEKIWKEIPEIRADEYKTVRKLNNCMQLHNHHFSEVFVSGSDLMVVRLCTTIEVYRFDVDRGLAFEEFRELPRDLNKMLNVADISRVAGHGDWIYIGGAFPSCSSILYNFRTQEWHPVSFAADGLLHFSDDIIQWLWTSVTYQPGLNPFLEVW